MNVEPWVLVAFAGFIVCMWTGLGIWLLYDDRDYNRRVQQLALKRARMKAARTKGAT